MFFLTVALAVLGFQGLRRGYVERQPAVVASGPPHHGRHRTRRYYTCPSLVDLMEIRNGKDY